MHSSCMLFFHGVSVFNRTICTKMYHLYNQLCHHDIDVKLNILFKLLQPIRFTIHSLNQPIMCHYIYN